MSVTMGHLLSLIRSTITMSGREFTVLEHLRYEHSHMSFFFLLLVIHLVSVGSVALSFPVVRLSVRLSDSRLLRNALKEFLHIFGTNIHFYSRMK